MRPGLLGSLCLTALASFLAVTAPLPAHAAEIHAPIPFEKYTLGNGLEVILHEDHRTPVVTVNIWYHVGSKDEPAGKNGFAHLFEHVMFQGSRDVGEDQFFKYLERAGTSDRNGSTNTDRTNYFETVPVGALPLVLWLESDRMGFLLDHVNQETFASQRDVVKNERRQNYENAPYGLVSKFVREAIYPASHPYHLTTIGTPEDLDAATLDDVRAFFKTFYLPNNATLVVAGDIDKAATKTLVDKYFATIAPGATPPVKSTPMPVTLDGEKRLDVQADVELPRVILSWPTPAWLDPADLTLDIAGGILSSGKSSRLHKRLVYDLQIAQDVSASEQSAQLGSTFAISVTLKKGKDPAEAIKIIDEELAKLRAAPPTDDELERTRTPILSRAVFGIERVGARAEILNQMNQIAHDPGFLDKQLAMYQALKPADIQTAVAQWLPAGKRVVTVVTPTPGAPRAGRLAGGK
ncbi:MAG TPA: pitrilysin family protein [Polyangiaceae bacterium]|jgi:predicted Zn-dependent peptidase